MAFAPSIPLGIDLGTSYSCVAAYRDGRTQTIPNDQGNRTTPSIVCFHDGDRLVGEGAATTWKVCPTNTICDSKRMIGRSFDDPLVQSDIPNWGFRVVEENGKPNIVIEENGQDMLITPEQVSAMVLAKIKADAELSLETVIFDAVITVPAYFTDAQRQATKDAAHIAGLNVLRMVNEPTAAAICYGTEKKFKKAQKILVFDLGGGTLDVSILTAEPNMKFTVMATHGDPHLGGKDFDNALSRMLADEYDQHHQEKLANDPEEMQRLREACEHAKKVLSFGQSARIAIAKFLGGEAYQRTVTRQEFETVCQDLFDGILTPVQAAIHDAKLKVADIEDVVLVGGSSRIPKVKEILQKFFAGKNLLHGAHPDESVANGAAIYAASLMNATGGDGPNITLVDVTPYTMGVETYGGDMTIFFPKNTRLPAQISRLFTTVFDKQESVKVQVFEGESDKAQENRLLGEVVLSGIEPAPRGTPQIMVTFDVDPNCLLSVSAVNRKDGNKVQAHIDNDKYNLPQAEIQRISDSLAEGAPEEQLRAQQQALWRRLVEYKNGVAQTLAYHRSRLSASEIQRATDSLRELEHWLARNQDATKTDIIFRQQEAMKDFRTVMSLLA